MSKKLMMLAAAVAVAYGAWASTPTISNATAKQRYPWNGKVDITYTLTGDVTAGLPSDRMPVLLLAATNRVEGTSYVADLGCVSGDTDTMEGIHHVVWDLNAQGIEFKSDNVVFTVAYSDKAKPYCVIDLSGGADALSYPVSYATDVPSGNVYKTMKLVLRLVEPGTFMMDGKYEVTLTKPFYCGVFEVTQRQWELVMGSNPCSSISCAKGNSNPVEHVSYDMIRGSSNGARWPYSSAVDTTSFLGKLRTKTGINGFDLPTEAQWEYACRAGTTTTYYWGGWMDDRCCWYRDNSDSTTHPVGEKRPNAWGLYDMSGNVEELCLDWWGTRTSGVTDPVGPSSGPYRITRGGSSWDSNPDICSSSNRSAARPSEGHFSRGFRIVRTLSK